jgi:hypothetical protein
MSFIDQIVDKFIESNIFSFMDGIFGYNQIQIHPEDQHKTNFIYPWGTFAYKNMSFGLQNVGVAFQRAMMFSFHDLKHIMEDYLDDLTAHLRKMTRHLLHFHLVFERCRHYKIRLNPHKCIFFVTLECLLGFIISNKGIIVDPLKVEALT